MPWSGLRREFSAGLVPFPASKDGAASSKPMGRWPTMGLNLAKQKASAEAGFWGAGCADCGR
jgi:hypothetical protein